MVSAGSLLTARACWRFRVGAVDSPTDLTLPDGNELRDASELRDGRGVGGLDQRLQRLADGHPSSPRYPGNRPPGGGGEPREVRPLSDAEHAEHVAEVRERLADARAAGLETDAQFTLDRGQEVWIDERDALHGAIVEDLYARCSEVPCEGKAILAGGLPGAGKTTVLREFADIDLSQYMMINPDVLKAEMAKRGLIPEVAGLSPMEASDLVHEEASHVAKRLASRAESDCRNVIWDFTMSVTSTIADRIDSLRSAGYARVEGVFVDIPVEVSVHRADDRHRQGHDEYRAGMGIGDRYIAEPTIMKYADSSWGSGNRKNFEELKPKLDGWSRYDNSVDGRAPVLVESHAARLMNRERS
jgi:predicted kinase